MGSTKTAFGLGVGIALVAASFSVSAAEAPQPPQVAATAPVFLQLEITSTCTDKGAAIRMINRGGKWPQMGALQLYYADTETKISERRLRLSEGQQVSFVVNSEAMGGRPVAVFVEPGWYERDFKFDAKIACN